MGCDIHLYREKLVNGTWLTADEWVDKYGEGADVPFEKQFRDRNYNLFGMLAGVRVREEPPYQFKPRGMPMKACDQVMKACEFWDTDGHSHSYLYLHEIKELRVFLASQTMKVSGMKHADELAALEASIASGNPDWNLLFPYCQWTTDKRQKEFCIDFPSDFMVGDALDRIIASLQDIGGDQQRIVFWFDN